MKTHLSGRRSLSLSGPDGSGKTTLTHEIRRRLEGSPWRVYSIHGYGCVLCRRLNRPTQVASLRPARRRSSRILRNVHGHVDAGELAVRLALLRGRSVVVRGPTLVIADRGPVDGLVKLGPGQGTRLERRFDRIGRGFDMHVILDAPPELLVLRDREHSLAELADLRALYLRTADELSRRMWPIVMIDASGDPETASRTVISALVALEGGPGSGVAPDTCRLGGARQQES